MFRHAQLESVKAFVGDPAHAGVPLHGRIQRAIRQLILDGALEVGRPLPASRPLAQSLGVSRDTVEAAYRQLHAEGFIERQVGSGSCVSRRARLFAGANAPRRPQAAAQAPRLSARGQALHGTGGVNTVSAPRPFAPGVPETRNFPLHVWERLQREVIREHGSAVLAHSPAQGMASLRRTIADYINLERGGHATPDRVLVLTSSQQALTLCANLLLDAGDRILVEDPMYHGASRAFDAAGLRRVPIAVDAEGMQVARLQRQGHDARAVFLTPSHQFPTGAMLSLDRRLALVHWANQNDAWIIEDDYDSEFHYAGKPTACVQGLDPHERTVYIGTFTKSLFPGLRIGYMVLPSALVAPMTVARSLMDGHSPTLSQLTLARFMEAGHFGAYVRAMRGIYVARRDALLQLVRAHLSDFVVPQVPAGGMQLPCFFKPGIDEQAVLEGARQAGVALQGLTALHASRTPQPGLLLGFAAYTPVEMEMAIKPLATVLRRVTGQV
ncbi:MAG: PLP-dependent aminotransferase family protein [Stenotrophomonas sp.]|uniref:MocR-like pyridoxine biosynthesis transcription factor PdxR n=1 Tax=Stenotrophomonas sp. TaxID=69392 RepID=UPI003D6D8078